MTPNDVDDDATQVMTVDVSDKNTALNVDNDDVDSNHLTKDDPTELQGRVTTRITC